MKDYKRLTERDVFGNADIIDLSTEKLYSELCFAETNLLTKTLNRLAELEDKLENGTLVELPFIQQPHQGLWEVYFFNTRINGVMYYLFTDKDEAEAKLRELKGERE